jgi:hypothetical protein
MENRFFERPILNSPYEYPSRHWELDKDGQPTQQIIERRRGAQFITPIPKPRKQKAARGAAAQRDLVLGEGAGVSTTKQLYDPTPVINELRVTNGVRSRTPPHGASRRRQPAFSNTGVTTPSPPSARSFARSKPSRPRSG